MLPFCRQSVDSTVRVLRQPLGLTAAAIALGDAIEFTFGKFDSPAGAGVFVCEAGNVRPSMPSMLLPADGPCRASRCFYRGLVWSTLAGGCRVRWGSFVELFRSEGSNGGEWWRGVVV